MPRAPRDPRRIQSIRATGVKAAVPYSAIQFVHYTSTADDDTLSTLWSLYSHRQIIKMNAKKAKIISLQIP